MVTEHAIDWATIERQAWWKALVGCPQDPRHHAEGDVATHTRMVVEELERGAGFDDLDGDTRRVLRWAALLHDAGKPATTKIQADGAITSNGHARVGANLARRFLWELGLSRAEREAICGLVRWHMRPGYCLESDDPERMALTIAQTARCDWLTRLAEADTRGRIAPNREEALLRVGLFGELAQSLGCWSEPFAFANDHSRFSYFRTPGRNPRYSAYDDTVAELVLLSGLPGAGKDTYRQRVLAELPHVTLDHVREELGVAPRDPQEVVVLTALDRARGFLRQKQTFVWNATNLRQEFRARPIQLAADYGYRVRIVALEVPPQRLLAQNRGRASAVPDAVIDRYIDRWEVPTLLEAHTLDWVE